MKLQCLSLDDQYEKTTDSIYNSLAFEIGFIDRFHYICLPGNLTLELQRSVLASHMYVQNFVSATLKDNCPPPVINLQEFNKNQKFIILLSDIYLICLQLRA